MIALDSSAVLALMLEEPGAEIVQDAAAAAGISSVNLTEVVSRLAFGKMPLARIERDFRKLEITVWPFYRAQAIRAGALRPLTASYGLSLGDRACLAEAEARKLLVLTGDGRLAEAGQSLGIEIQMIRERPD